MSKILFRAAGLALALACGPLTNVTAQPSPPAAKPAGPTVAIDNFLFGPASLTVPLGTTVTWVNHDDDPHTVVARDGSFRSAVLDSNEAFAFTFIRPGQYDYFCSIHPHMTGKVVVTGA